MVEGGRRLGKATPSLDDLIGRLIQETADVTIRGGREFYRGPVLFVVRPAPDVVELRLGPDIAEAAMRTAGTGPSDLGADWVRLETRDWASAGDRLEAWFRVAWRLAAKGPRR